MSEQAPSREYSFAERMAMSTRKKSDPRLIDPVFDRATRTFKVDGKPVTFAASSSMPKKAGTCATFEQAHARAKALFARTGTAAVYACFEGWGAVPVFRRVAAYRRDALGNIWADVTDTRYA